MAVGQDRRIDLFEQFGVRYERGVVQVDDDMMTTRDGVYAAGDCIFEGGGSNEATVVLAVEQGKQAAYAIHQRLTRTWLALQEVSREV